jgi:hypothetical protein
VEWQGALPVLGSLFHSTAWPPTAPLRAACEKRRNSLVEWLRRRLHRPRACHAAPQWDCECGVYGMVDLKQDEDLEASPQFYQRGPLDRVLRVVGVANLWGHVVQHEHGYRAEYARPVAVLAVPSLTRLRDAEALLDAVAHRYAVRVVTRVGDLGGTG